MGKGFFVLMMLLFVLFSSEEVMVKGEEGRMCETADPARFSCWRDHQCRNSCESSGFKDGKCKGLTRRCYCYKLCDGSAEQA